MKKSKNARYMAKLALMIVAGVFISFFSPQFSMAQDFDEDGILDELENGTDLICVDSTKMCATPPLDKYVPDLFIIFVKANRTTEPPELPSDPFELMPRISPDGPHSNCIIDVYQQERCINIHEFNPPSKPVSQNLSGTSQNALLLIEDLDPTDGDIGTSNIGYPAYGNGISGRVFTKRIWDDVVNACSLQQNCILYGKDLESGIDPWKQIFWFYTKNVISHETFHMLGRVIPADRKVDYHYPQLGYIMDHHMYYKEYKKDKRVEWFITDKWSADDIPRFK